MKRLQPSFVSGRTGLSLEEHLKNVCAGGSLEGCGNASQSPPLIFDPVADINARLEDRTRPAPVPNCRADSSFEPSALLRPWLSTTAVAEGMWKFTSMIEEGLTPRDAVASVLRENVGAVSNSDGYSPEWQVEAAKRGLANEKIGIEAVDKLTGPSSLPRCRPHTPHGMIRFVPVRVGRPSARSLCASVGS